MDIYIDIDSQAGCQMNDGVSEGTCAIEPPIGTVYDSDLQLGIVPLLVHTLL